MLEKSKSKKMTKKVWSIVEISVISIIIMLFILGIVFELAAPETAFAIWSKANILDVTKIPEVWAAHQKTFIHCVMLIVLILAVSKILRLAFQKIMQKSNRAKTVITLLDGIIKYGAALALIFLALQAFGVNTAAIWESVGIIILIISLGV